MSKIYDSQNRIKALLDADPYFSGAAGPGNNPPASKLIPTVTRRQGNVAQLASEAIGKLGIVAIVMLPKATFTGESARIALDLTFVVMIKENPVVNQSTAGTNKPAESAVERAIQLIHWKPNLTNVGSSRSNLFQINKNAVQLLRPTPGDAPLTYAISVDIQINL